MALRISYLDPTLTNNLTLETVCLYQRDYQGALDYVLKRGEHLLQSGNQISPDSYHGFIYLKNGRPAEADWNFKGLIDRWLIWLKNKQQYSSCRTFLQLARIYSGMGDKGKAMEYLRKAINCRDWSIPFLWILELKNHPMFDTIRDEPEFQKFISDMEAKFAVERVKIEKVLREEGVLASENER